jgi:F-type H+-transporting ATPase subunit delta
MAKESHITPVARAYAQSLLDLADRAQQSKEIGQELEQVTKVVESDPKLTAFFSNPAISDADRGAVLEKAFRGRVADLLVNTLLVMNRKNRLNLLRQMADAYAELLQQRQGIIEVDLYVAERLTPDQLELARQKVSAALRREAVVHQYVDPSLIGGVLIRVEDRLLDASVRARLRAVRRQLLAARPR